VLKKEGTSSGKPSSSLFGPTPDGFSSATPDPPREGGARSTSTLPTDGAQSAGPLIGGGKSLRSRRRLKKEALQRKKKPAKQWPLQVLQMAEALEIDPVSEEAAMWVAEKAVAAPVKPPWAKYLEKDGTIYYFNAETKASQWRHPYEQEWRNLVREEREKQVAVETTVEDEDGNAKAAVVYQREPTFVPDPKRYAVLIESLRPSATVYNHLNPAPPEWGLIKVARETAGRGMAEKVKTWYHAECRAAQIPYVSATFELYDKLPNHDPRAGQSGEGAGAGTELNGETVVSLGLSLNNLTSLKSGSLAAFIHLRRLDLSTNCLSSSEGLGVATGLVDLDLSNNRFTTPSDLRGDASMVASSPGLIALRNLQSLRLDHNAIFNIKPLLRLTTLTMLTLDSNKLKNLHGVEALSNLCTLGARDNALTETTGVMDVQYPETRGQRIKMQASLTELDLAGNKLTDMGELMERFHPECELVAIDLAGNSITDDISHRYVLLDRFQSLMQLDNQEVKPAMRRQLADMHRQEKVKGIAQAVKESYLERLARERQRKDWGVEALRSQERTLEELFMQMQAKMEAEVLRTTSQMLVGPRQRMSDNMVKRARELAAKLRETQERDALAFADQVPRGSAVGTGMDLGVGMGAALQEAEDLGKRDRDEIRRKALRGKVMAVMAAQTVGRFMMAK